MKRYATILCALAFTACALPTISSAPTTGTPTAALGEIALVNGIRVRPLKVLEDSRCPINVTCVWAGRLVVRAEIDGGAGADFADLTLGQPLGVGGKLTLVSVQPSKEAGVKTDPHSYRFTFQFDGGL